MREGQGSGICMCLEPMKMPGVPLGQHWTVLEDRPANITVEKWLGSQTLPVGFLGANPSSTSLVTLGNFS